MGQWLTDLRHQEYPMPMFLHCAVGHLIPLRVRVECDFGIGVPHQVVNSQIQKSLLELQFEGKLTGSRISRRWCLSKFRRLKISSGLRNRFELAVIKHIEELCAEL